MPKDIKNTSYFEFESGEKGFLFYEKAGKPTGYRISYEGEVPLRAERLDVTHYGKTGDVALVGFTDNDGAKVTMAAMGTEPPKVLIDGDASKHRYVNETDNPGVAGLIDKIEGGQLKVIDPKNPLPDPAGATHDPLLAKGSFYVDDKGGGYAALSKTPYAPSNGEQMELAKVAPDGTITYYKGTATDAHRSGYSLNTDLGQLKTTLFAATLDDKELRRASPIEEKAIGSALGLPPVEPAKKPLAAPAPNP